MNSSEFLKNLFTEALKEMAPERVIKRSVALDNHKLQILGEVYEVKDSPLYLFAVGKAAVSMTMGIQDIVGDRIRDMLIISPDDIPMSLNRGTENKVIFGSHPYPDKRSLSAGKEALNFFRELPANATVLSLISGGASSLMCLPADTISIEEFNKINRLLLNSGATIHEINAVRKHCSGIKGGQLLKHLESSVRLINLVISDVPDDNLEIIGSGPTVPDSSTYQDAYHILLEYELWNEISESIKTHIEKGLTGEVQETFKYDDTFNKDHPSFVISSAQKLARQAAKIAEQNGYETWVADEAYTTDVEETANEIATKAISMTKSMKKTQPPSLLLYYGESTVQVTGSGKGGRNQELALLGALKIAGFDDITWLSAGTDGIDGPTDAAGAVVNGRTIQEAKKKGVDPEGYLKKNDSYHFHKKLDTLFKTGPTGNNLMDVVWVWLGQED